METPSPTQSPSSAGLTTGLTVWETKERAGLLALETEEWREKRLIAEDPDTTASVLIRLADEIEAIGSTDAYNDPKDLAALLAGAVVSHPNTPLPTLQKVMGYKCAGLPSGLGLPLCASALCRNPAAPFFQLEQPEFWQRLEDAVCLKMLHEAALPVAVASALQQSQNAAVSDAARLHVSQAAPLQTPAGGNHALTKYWQNYCLTRKQLSQAPADLADLPPFLDLYAELTDLELCPPCLTPFMPDFPPQPFPIPEPVIAFHERAEAEKDVPVSAPPPLPDRYDRYITEYRPACEKKLNYLLRYHATPAELKEAFFLARTMAVSGDDEWVPFIATHRNVTPDILRLIESHLTGYHAFRFFLAQHPLTPPGVLNNFIGSGSMIPLAFLGTEARLRRLVYRNLHAPPDIRARARTGFAKSNASAHYEDPFMGFWEYLQGATDEDALRREIRTNKWDRRLCIALSLPTGAACHVPFVSDAWNRTPRELMEHLAHDGNRLVRWAAQTRLVDPDFTFTWHEESDN